MGSYVGPRNVNIINNSDNSFDVHLLRGVEDYEIPDINYTKKDFVTGIETIVSYTACTDIQEEYPGVWVRPSDWLTIDDLVTDGDQKMVGLFAVFPTGTTGGYVNYCTIYATAAFTVDWGDGNTTNYSSGTRASHTYDYDSISASTYCSRGYKQVIVTVTPQGGNNLTVLNLGYRNAEVTAYTYYRYIINWLDIVVSGTEITSFKNYQDGNSSLLEHFRGYQITNKCTDMLNMFYYCKSLQSIDLSNWNTSNVTNMSYAFYYCNSLPYVDLNGFDTSKVTNMSAMFAMCTSINNLNLSNFNTSNVTNMSSMFSSCYNLQYLDLSSFNTTKATTFSGMFTECYRIQTIDTSSFDTSNVTVMNSMISYCYILRNFDFSNFNTAKVTTFNNTFNGCGALTSINLSGTTLSACTDNTTIFGSNYSATIIRVPGISKTFTIASSKLDATALNNLFGDLKDLTGGSAQTITITGNPGAATCDKTIATNKNWTVVS